MATEPTTVHKGETRAASTAAGGTAMSTTADIIGLPEGTRHVALHAHTYASSATVVKFALVPYLMIIKTADSLATAPTDYSSEAQDASTSTVVTLDALNTAAEGDFLYVGSHSPFRGVDIDVTAANGTSSVLTVKYWNGSAWADISDTDGTISSGKTLAQDGQVTWTIPAAWTADSLVDIGDASSAVGAHVGRQDVYWTRWEVGTQIDGEVELGHMLAMARSTAYAELTTGQDWESLVGVGPGGDAGVEGLTDTGTAKLIVNASTLGRAIFA